ncbi:MAG: type II toxin-antitoxin system mRNA interferase toxin, RelE/StbE family [Candidatus Gracilibacteria bacterium]|jgi:addiction module RelE/StbE family toxin
MQIIFTDNFKKKFRALPQKIKNQFEKRLGVFIKDPLNPLLKIHPLKGNMIGLRAFSITGDYRTIYRLLNHECAELIDIGTHSKIYK